MSEFKKHLYAIMHPNRALVASQLEPMEFGRQYSVGTKRYYQGKVLFIEVDPSTSSSRRQSSMRTGLRKERRLSLLIGF